MIGSGLCRKSNSLILSAMIVWKTEIEKNLNEIGFRTELEDVLYR